MSAIDWTKMPSLTALRAFEAAAQSGSFSAAARSLNVTHAAVAQQVRALEDYLGLVLIHRSPRGVALSADGKALADSLRDGFLAIPILQRALCADISRDDYNLCLRQFESIPELENIRKKLGK